MTRFHNNLRKTLGLVFFSRKFGIMVFDRSRGPLKLGDHKE